MHRVTVYYPWDIFPLMTFSHAAYCGVGSSFHDQCEKPCTSFLCFLPPFLLHLSLNAWHFKGAWCLHLVCIWKDINFYSHACVASALYSWDGSPQTCICALQDLWSVKNSEKPYVRHYISCGFEIECLCESYCSWNRSCAGDSCMC